MRTRKKRGRRKATNDFHRLVKLKKSEHWNRFLEELKGSEIWKAHKYYKPNPPSGWYVWENNAGKGRQLEGRLISKDSGVRPGRLIGEKALLSTAKGLRAMAEFVTADSKRRLGDHAEASDPLSSQPVGGLSSSSN
jgi:hypothetical protein